MKKTLLLLLLCATSAVAQYTYVLNPFTGKLDATLVGAGGGTVTSVSGTGTVSGISISGTVTGSGNLTLGGTLSVGPTELQSTAVTPGSYTIANITVDADGRITSAASGTVGPTELQSTAVTPGDYTTANITVDADGRVTAAANGAGGAPGDADYITKTANGTLSNEFALGSLATGLLQVTTTTGDLTSIASSGTGNVARVASPTFTGTLTAAAGTFSGLVTANATLTVGNGGTSSGILRIMEDSDTGSMFASFQVPTLGSSTVYTLPPDDGNSGDVLRSDGAGTLTWVPQSGGAPTGAAYITQTPDGTLSAEQALSLLSTGIMRVATTTGAVTSLTDSGGIFSNISDETGSGVLVGATSPTLVTPVLGVATATSINKVVLTAPASAATLTIADGKTLTASNTLTFTGTDASSVAFGTGGTVTYTANNLSVFAATTSAQLAGVLSDETGTGVSVFGTSPSFTTQITAPKVIWTGAVQDLTGSGTPEGAITAAIGSVYRRTDGGAATSLYVKESGAGNTGWVAYGSPAGSGAPTTATYITQTADGTLSAEQALSSLSTGIMRVATTTGAITSLTDSAGILGNISDETGSGLLVGATSPTLVTPTIGVATATSVNKVAITAPASSATLTIADGKTLTASNTLTFTGTDASSVAFGVGGTVIYAANNLGALAATTSAQLAGVISNETGSGALVFGTSPTVTTPTVSGSLTFSNGFLYAVASMAALSIDTAQLKNTKTISADATLTFSAQPATGVWFGLLLDNSDTAPHTITIPSSFSDGLGTTRTTFVLAGLASTYIRWEHQGAGVYRMYGEPIRIVDETLANIAVTDAIEYYNPTDGLHKYDTVAGIGELFVSDTAFASTWDGPSTIAPSKNAVYDWAHTFDTDDNGSPDALVGNSTASARIKLYEDTDNGTNFVMLVAPAAITTDSTLTLPEIAADTLVGKITTDVMQNKDLTNANNTLPCEFQIACSDMTTAITAATNKAYFRAPYAFTLTAVRASAFTAPTGATILIDVNESGTTVISTKIMIDASEKTSTTAATPAVISDSAIADDAEITIDFDQVGSSVAGAGIIVTLIGTR